MAIVANPTQFGPKRILTGDEPFSPVDFSLLTKDELHQIYFALLDAKIVELEDTVRYLQEQLAAVLAKLS